VTAFFYSICEKCRLIGIEAKADESFGDNIGDYYDRQKANGRSNVPKRIENLASALFRDLDPRIRELRYQLLHGLASTLIEAHNRHCDAALFVVHEFLSERLRLKNVQRNGKDWLRFTEALGINGSGNPKAAWGPIYVPGGGFVPADIPLYGGKIQTQL
jgi:hypothetical protein